MPSSIETHPNRPPRILVLRLGSMGDIIHAMPAVTVLRQLLPSAVIGWVIERRWKDLLCLGAPQCTCQTTYQAANNSGIPLVEAKGKPLVDLIHQVNTLAWRKDLWSSRTWHEIREATGEIRAAKYDIAVDLQGAWKSAVIAELSGARLRFGFGRPREKGVNLLYNRQHLQTEDHVVEQNIGLAWDAVDVIQNALGNRASVGVSPASLKTRSLPRQNFRPERRRPSDLPRVAFPTDPQIDQWCTLELKRHELDRGAFAIINPGAGWGAKCWPVERYAEVAAGLANQGIRSVINFGPSEEGLATQLQTLSGGSAIPVGCSISQLVALARRACLFLGGDTGPLHLAAALGVPVVAIFGPTDPARNGPFGTANIVLRSPESRTSHARVAATEEGLLSITSAEVLNAVRQLIASVRNLPVLSPADLPEPQGTRPLEGAPVE